MDDELLSLDNTLLDEDLLQCHDRTVYLFVGVRSHEGIAYQRVLRSTGRRNDGVDEDTGLKGEGCHEERLLHVADIQRNDGTLGLTNLEAFLAETLQGIVGDIPQGLDALRFLLRYSLTAR